MNEKTDFRILCRRVGEIPDPPPEKKAERDHCPGCNHEIWIGPESRRRRQRELGAKILCSHCTFDEVGNQPHAILGSASQLVALQEHVKDRGLLLPFGLVEGDADDFMRKIKEKDDFGINSKN